MRTSRCRRPSLLGAEEPRVPRPQEPRPAPRAPGCAAMFRPDGSPMRSEASSASRSRSRPEGEPLPLIDCPECGIPLVKLRSKKRDSYGMVFYKCPNNFPVSLIRIEVCSFRLISGLA